MPSLSEDLESLSVEKWDAAAREDETVKTSPAARFVGQRAIRVLHECVCVCVFPFYGGATP